MKKSLEQYRKITLFAMRSAFVLAEHLYTGITERHTFGATCRLPNVISIQQIIFG